MKRLIIRIVVILLLIVTIHQVYWYNKLDGNLVIYMSNVSEKDSIIDLNLYLDGEKVATENINNEFLSIKVFPFKVFPGKHQLLITANNNAIKEEYNFYSLLVTRIIIEYNGKSRDQSDLDFIIGSEWVLGNFIIQ